MKSAYKKFDQKLHDKYDHCARSIVSSFICSQRYGIVVMANPDMYGPDLIIEDEAEDEVYYGECEIKNNWSGAKFPFKTVQFPLRKQKFMKLDKKCYFFMLNKEKTYVLTVDGKDILKSPVKEVKNKYIPNGEMFFQVPIERTKIYKVKNG